MDVQPAHTLGSALHMLESQSTGRSYRIAVALPLGYNAQPGAKWPFHAPLARWPTVYVLDGNWYFGMVTDTIRPMSWCGSTTDAIVVGIGYAESEDPVESFRVAFSRRDHDLTPVRDLAEEAAGAVRNQRPTPTGDGANFLKFITTEVVPFIEANYNADPERRILLGHSYGGLFALLALFTAPSFFETLVVGSPTLAYGERCMFAYEEAYAREHNDLRARVYLFAAEEEESAHDTTLTDTLRMAAILEGRKYTGLVLKKAIFRDLNHCEVAAPGLQAGLKFALRKG